MRSSFLGVLVGVGLCLSLAPETGWTEPSFSLGFDGPLTVSGDAGMTTDFDLVVRLATEGLAAGDPGPQGWSVAVSAESCAIHDATTAGTAADTTENGGLRDPASSFELTEVTAAGAVSVVILSLGQDVTLDPGGSPHDILRLTMRDSAPASFLDDCGECVARLTDGLEGSAEPVDNRVVVGGEPVLPELTEATVEVCARSPFSMRIDGETERTVTVGTLSASLRPNVTLAAESEGVQGWSVSVVSAGDCEMTAATTDGTIGADANVDPEGLRQSGFEKTDLASDYPPERNGGRLGAVSAVVLSFTMPIVVPVGEHKILNLTVDCDTSAAAIDDELVHSLSFPPNDPSLVPEDGPLTGAGQPVKSVVTFQGNTVDPATTDATLRVTVGPVLTGDFVRCDPNNDGRNDIADAIRIVNELFRGGPAAECPDASDCNDDEMVDLSDAVFAVAYQFEDGAPPPPPFPDCGEDDDVTEVSCPAGTTLCP